MQDMISSARVAEANVSTRTAAMCVGPEAGGRFEIRELPRKEPAADESRSRSKPAAVNPLGSATLATRAVANAGPTDICSQKISSA